VNSEENMAKIVLIKMILSDLVDDVVYFRRLQKSPQNAILVG